MVSGALGPKQTYKRLAQWIGHIPPAKAGLKNRMAALRKGSERPERVLSRRGFGRNINHS